MSLQQDGGAAGGRVEAPAGKDAAVATTRDRCGFPSCAAEARKHCTVCKTVYYCGVEHQRGHWKAQKVECSRSSEAASALAGGGAAGGAGAAAPEGKDAGEGGGGGDAGRAPPGKHDLLADVQRWFTELANPEYDADMLVALPLPPAATGVEDRQSRCAVVMCGNDDDEDIVQPRSCRANGCSYHRKCLDRQVRDGATARNH